jgi:hypothetical protein
MMKKETMRVMGVLLMAGLLVLAACSDGGGGVGSKTPPVSSLPDFPTGGGITAPSSQLSLEEVEDILAGLQNVVENIRDAAEEVVEENSTETETDKEGNYSYSNTWNFKNQKDGDEIVNVTSDGNYLEKAVGSSTGGTFTSTDRMNVKVTLLEDVASYGTTVYTGSVIEEKTDMQGTVKVNVNISTGAGTISVSGRNNASWSYGLTVSNGTIAVKIIFNASVKVSGSDSEQVSFASAGDYEDLIGETVGEIQEDLMEDAIISGTLKVYGAGDKEVFDLEIDDLETLNEYLDYFDSGYYYDYY